MLLERALQKFHTAEFNYLCKEITHTKPVKLTNNNVVILSQLHPPAIYMYLIALKSLLRYVDVGKVVIVSDGLNAKNIRTLKYSIDNLEIIHISDINTEGCPTGGTWERLIQLSKLNTNSYVIQLDSDTITLAQPNEVIDCIINNESFTLGTDSGTCFKSLEECSIFAEAHKCDHVQNHAERELRNLHNKSSLKYVRGCSGFTGFAQGQLELQKIIDFSRSMSNLLGEDRWREWGTEQVTSNFMAANAHPSRVLPVDRYPFYITGLDLSKPAFIHFFGTFRFNDGTYKNLSLKLINELLHQPSALERDTTPCRQ